MEWGGIAIVYTVYEPDNQDTTHSNNVSCTIPIIQAAARAPIELVAIRQEAGRHRAPVILCTCFSDVDKAAVCAAIAKHAFHQCFKNVSAL